MRSRSFAIVALLMLACSEPAVKSTGTPSDHLDATEAAVFPLSLEELSIDGEPELGTVIRFVPDRSELLLLTQTGRVLRYALADGEFSLLDEVQLPHVAGYDDCGLVSMAFDPAFADNGFVYFGHCTSGTSSSVTRYTWQGDALDSMLGSEVEVLAVGAPASQRPWHNVGAIGFDRTGALWAQLGEKTIQMNAQDPSNKLGKLVRVLPDPEAPGGHRPAPDNAWPDDATRDPDVFALGFRSPWQGTYDAAHDRWLVGDVGADNIEELNLVTRAGQNFGWPTAEGPCNTEMVGDGCAELTDPIAHYLHALRGRYVEEDAETVPTTDRAVWVTGPLGALDEDDPYDGRLAGRFLFGDMFTGWVRLLAIDDDGSVSFDELIGHLRFATSWAQGPDGYLYGIRFGDYKGHSDDPRVRLYRARPRGVSNDAP